MHPMRCAACTRREVLPALRAIVRGSCATARFVRPGACAAAGCRTASEVGATVPTTAGRKNTRTRRRAGRPRPRAHAATCCRGRCRTRSAPTRGFDASTAQVRAACRKRKGKTRRTRMGDRADRRIGPGGDRRCRGVRLVQVFPRGTGCRGRGCSACGFRAVTTACSRGFRVGWPGTGGVGDGGCGGAGSRARSAGECRWVSAFAAGTGATAGSGRGAARPVAANRVARASAPGRSHPEDRIRPGARG